MGESAGQEAFYARTSELNVGAQQLSAPRWLAGLCALRRTNPRPNPAALPRRLQTVLRLAHDVAPAVLGQRDGQVKDEVALGVLAGGDALDYLDRDAALE